MDGSRLVGLAKMVSVRNAVGQLELFNSYVNDPRGRIALGFDQVDRLLRRGGVAAGELVLIGGHTGTRKTTFMLNILVRMLRAGVPCGLVGLDEPDFSYIGKLLSTTSGVAVERIEDEWPNPALEAEYYTLADKLVTYEGHRPTLKELEQWLYESEREHGIRPQVVFIDYLSELVRWNNDGGETQRMVRLAENLKIWTRENELTTICLHQVGRTDEGTGVRYHGSTPMSLEGLRYAGEEPADIVLGCYRPSLDPFGNMSMDMAKLFKGSSFSEEEWQLACERVEKYQEYSFVQLLKNRPGTKVDRRGIPLRSIGESIQMEEDMSIYHDEERIMAYGPEAL